MRISSAQSLGTLTSAQAPICRVRLLQPRPARQSPGPARRSFPERPDTPQDRLNSTPGRPDGPLAGQTGRQGPDSLPSPARSPCLSSMPCQVTLPPRPNVGTGQPHTDMPTQSHATDRHDIRNGGRKSGKMVTRLADMSPCHACRLYFKLTMLCAFICAGLTLVNIHIYIYTVYTAV